MRVNQIVAALLFSSVGLVWASPAVAGKACVPTNPETCTLGELATHLGIRFGSTLEDFETADANYVEILSREFNAVTPENALKLYATQATQGVWSFTASDAVVATAESEGLEIRGHSLVWSQNSRTPDWVKAISDPDDLWTVTADQITELMTRYVGRVDRWDVVNEPLETFGTVPSASVFWSIGDDWIKRAFDLADSIDPQAELWINEYGTDWVNGKHEAYLELVKNLVDAGTPIDGVGIQTHRLPGIAIDQDLFEEQLRDFTRLGLKVAITELDVPVSPSESNALAWQATEYGKVVAACLAVVGCTEITLWGLSDRDTWLDSLGTFAVPTRPLLFDNDLQPKLAYTAVREAMANAILSRELPVPGGPDGELPVTGGPDGRILSLGLLVTLVGLSLLVRRRQVNGADRYRVQFK